MIYLSQSNHSILRSHLPSHSLLTTAMSATGSKNVREIRELQFKDGGRRTQAGDSNTCKNRNQTVPVAFGVSHWLELCLLRLLSGSSYAGQALEGYTGTLPHGQHHHHLFKLSALAEGVSPRRSVAR